MKQVNRFDPGTEAAKKWKDKGDPISMVITNFEASNIDTISGIDTSDSDSDKTVLLSMLTDDDAHDDLTTINGEGEDLRKDGVVTDDASIDS